MSRGGDIRRVENVGTDPARARLGRKALKVTTAICAGSGIVTTKVGAREATEATLRLVEWRPTMNITDKHAEALSLC